MIPFLIAWWTIFFGLYLLFASKLAGSEVVVGFAAAALAATGATLTSRAARQRFRARVRWLLLLGRLPGRILTDCGMVGLALWRRLARRKTVKGKFRTIPFDPGGQDALSTVRRALVTAGISLAPNTYVVAIDRRRRVLLVHQLIPSARLTGKGDREWPL